MSIIKNYDTITLKDGRKISYAEYGDTGGSPVIYNHGFPGSHGEGMFLHNAASKLGLHIIAPDRPGYGLSDFVPGRKILDWPVDLCEIAECFGYEKFSIIGYSGGGPYAAACAAKIPERLEKVLIISGLSPMDAAELATVPKSTYIEILKLGKYSPPLVKWILEKIKTAAEDKPETVISIASTGLSDPDEIVLACPDIAEIGVQNINISLNQDPVYVAYDAELYGNDWGFMISGIEKPVVLYHGTDDRLVPPEMGRYYEKTIPRCRASFFENEGHVSIIVNNSEEMLSSLCQ